jgi:two-component system cell cycle response regulator DivK
MCQVLIIEDTPVNMLLAATILSRAGHEPLQAANAVDGVQMARKSRPDVILMDLGMPNMDGFTATRILKADPATQNIPIIALTAFAIKGDKERALAAGCDRYLTKPITRRILLAELESVLRGRSRIPRKNVNGNA